MNRTSLYQAVAILAGVPWEEVRRYANGHRLHDYPKNADKIAEMEWPTEAVMRDALCPRHRSSNAEAHASTTEGRR